MTKCDFCNDELTDGGLPACVAACPTRALEFGEYDQLVRRPGAELCMAPMPPAELTAPNFILKPHKKAKPGLSAAGGIVNPEEVKDA